MNNKQAETIEQQASTIVALKEQVSTLQADAERHMDALVEASEAVGAEAHCAKLARNDALEKAAEICESRRPASREDCPEHWKAYEKSWGIRLLVANECAAAIRALASQPAAPVQPTSLVKWALRELLEALPERRDWLNPDAESVLRAALAAPPVQQPGDVRDLQRYSPTWERGPDGTSARMELDNAMGQYVKLPDVEAALATTRPSAALTAEALRAWLRNAYSLGQLYWQQADSDSTKHQDRAPATRDKFNELMSDACAILAASSGAVAVPEVIITDPDAKGYRPPCCDRGVPNSACCDMGCAADRELAEMRADAAPATPAQGQTK